MKKKIINFCFVLCFINVNSQSIVIDYSVKINKEERTEIDEILDTFIFKLFANDTESMFKLEGAIQTKDELKYSLAKAIIVDGYNEYYINNFYKNTITRKEFAGNFFIIESPLNKYSWKITKETKKIENFTCFKATRIIQETRHKDNKVINVEVIAWFCPKINYSFGPIGNYGLPGMILELRKGKIIYFANKIELGKDIITIEIPKKGRKVTINEFNNIVQDFVEN